jgi:hypothetical protein
MLVRLSGKPEYDGLAGCCVLSRERPQQSYGIGGLAAVMLLRWRPRTLTSGAASAPRGNNTRVAASSRVLPGATPVWRPHAFLPRVCGTAPGRLVPDPQPGALAGWAMSIPPPPAPYHPGSSAAPSTAQQTLPPHTATVQPSKCAAGVDTLEPSHPDPEATANR